MSELVMRGWECVWVRMRMWVTRWMCEEVIDCVRKLLCQTYNNDQTTILNCKKMLLVWFPRTALRHLKICIHFIYSICIMFSRLDAFNNKEINLKMHKPLICFIFRQPWSGFQSMQTWWKIQSTSCHGSGMTQLS